MAIFLRISSSADWISLTLVPFGSDKKKIGQNIEIIPTNFNMKKLP
jgi:hypothetical protein